MGLIQKFKELKKNKNQETEKENTNTEKLQKEFSEYNASMKKAINDFDKQMHEVSASQSNNISRQINHMKKSASQVNNEYKELGNIIKSKNDSYDELVKKFRS